MHSDLLSVLEGDEGKIETRIIPEWCRSSVVPVCSGEINLGQIFQRRFDWQYLSMSLRDKFQVIGGSQ